MKSNFVHHMIPEVGRQTDTHIHIHSDTHTVTHTYIHTILKSSSPKITGIASLLCIDKIFWLNK